MNRLQFLTTLLAAAKAGTPQSTVPQPATRPRAQRRQTEYTGRIAARPEAVFPLLCPVREYEWLDGWQCRMIYSDSGVAEDNCLFETNFHGQKMIWTVARYAPPRRIEFTVLAPDDLAVRLQIELKAHGSSTRIQWRRAFTGLSERGNLQIHEWRTERDAELTAGIEHFLKTGTMRKPEA
ncbi:SRPBCC family protein [uncultured Paludibaculum sp.]|uniref:SRPBCC family protein n=1 Tax=uncultured Paludibaculum sp. TaxID=1765020 RepID=UPI002AABCF52|nr:SRPBCC family protein [uncultured Paludibaculum sp.]